MNGTDSSKAWAPLTFFESSDYTFSRYEELHGRQPNATKLAEIGSAFRQARLFYQSYRGADFVVQPLILYYCILALSRGLILVLERSRSEANLARQHGLACDGWDASLNQQRSDVGGLRIKIEKGTFLELLSASKNICLVRANSSKVNWSVRGEIPSPGEVAEFLTLCAHIPDLAEEFEKWTGQKLLAVKLLSSTTDTVTTLKLENIRRLSGQERLSVDYLGQIFPKALNIDASTLTVTLTKGDVPLVVTIIETAPFQIGDALVLPHVNGNFISELGIMFMLSFGLGMLARYYPSHWIAFQSLGRRGSFYPYCSRLLDYLGYAFPRAASDLLSNSNML
jgi:YaaC-like Protein